MQNTVLEFSIFKFDKTALLAMICFDIFILFILIRYLSVNSSTFNNIIPIFIFILLIVVTFNEIKFYHFITSQKYRLLHVENDGNIELFDNKDNKIILPVNDITGNKIVIYRYGQYGFFKIGVVTFFDKNNNKYEIAISDIKEFIKLTIYNNIVEEKIVAFSHLPSNPL